MTKRERMLSDAEGLARRALGPNADAETLRAVAEKIFCALPRQVRQTA
jgi:hypothetical protein